MDSVNYMSHPESPSSSTIVHVDDVKHPSIVQQWFEILSDRAIHSIVNVPLTLEQLRSQCPDEYLVQKLNYLQVHIILYVYDSDRYNWITHIHIASYYTC